MSEAPSRLSNPYPYNGGVGVEKVSGHISAEVFSYFFRHVLAGNPGNRQNLVALFFAKLHAECVARGLPGVYDPDNEKFMAELMHNLNFRSEAQAKQPAKPKKPKTPK